jgi:hypothetical protein
VTGEGRRFFQAASPLLLNMEGTMTNDLNIWLSGVWLVLIVIALLTIRP